MVSFADATLVSSIGETIEEVGREFGFLTNVPTLAEGGVDETFNSSKVELRYIH